VESRPQVSLDSDFATTFRIQAPAKKFETATPRVFCPIHRGIRILQQGLYRCTVFREHRDANTGAQVMIRTRDRECLTKLSQQNALKVVVKNDRHQDNVTLIE